MLCVGGVGGCVVVGGGDDVCVVVVVGCWLLLLLVMGVVWGKFNLCEPKEHKRMSKLMDGDVLSKVPAISQEIAQMK